MEGEEALEVEEALQGGVGVNSNDVMETKNKGDGGLGGGGGGGLVLVQCHRDEN